MDSSAKAATVAVEPQQTHNKIKMEGETKKSHSGGAKPKLSSTKAVTQDHVPRNGPSRRKSSKSFNYAHAYVELKDKLTKTVNENKTLMGLLERVSAEKDDLREESQYLLAANTQSMSRITTIKDERPDADKIDELQVGILARDEILEQMEHRHLLDAEEMLKVRKEISICRNTIDILKDGVREKELVVERTEMKLSELEIRLMEYKRDAQIRQSEDNTKALGIAVAFGHTIKMNEDANYRKDAEIVQLKSLQSHLRAQFDCISGEKNDLQTKLSEKDQIIEFMKTEIQRYKNKTLGRRFKNLFGCRGARSSSHNEERTAEPLQKAEQPSDNSATPSYPSKLQKQNVVSTDSLVKPDPPKANIDIPAASPIDASIVKPEVCVTNSNTDVKVGWINKDDKGKVVPNKSVIDGKMAEKKSVSNSNMADNKPVSNGNMADNKSVNDGNMADNKSVSNSNMADNKPVSDGKMADNKSVSDGKMANNKSVSNGNRADNKSVSNGNITEKESVNNGSALTESNSPATDGLKSSEISINDSQQAEDNNGDEACQKLAKSQQHVINKADGLDNHMVQISEHIGNKAQNVGSWQ